MAKFKAGDIVQLKSGGPNMTVSEHDASFKRYECTWFAGRKCEHAYFPETSLVTAEDDGSKKEQK